VRLKLRKPYHTGQTDIVFEPVQFLRRLAATIPHPGQYMVRFHGVFAPRSNVRQALEALLPQPPAAQPDANTGQQADAADTVAVDPLPQDAQSTPQYRRSWAQLLKRVFGHEVLVCPKCQGPMRRIQFVDDPAVIARICSHLGLPTAPPHVASARAPLQHDFVFAS